MNMQQLLEEWTNFDYVSRKLNIFVKATVLLPNLVMSMLPSSSNQL